MVELIQPPDPHTLLPPLLACLPTAFASSRPPPVLLPLLSPILRQRLSYVSSTDNWLKLLCWDRDKAETLWEQVENSTFEPHPSSGEIEVGDVDSITYKRFDEETLRTQVALSDWHFTPVFLWCSGSNDGDGWQLAELLPSPEHDSSWSSSIQTANDSAKERILSEAIREAEQSTSATQPAKPTLAVPKDKDDDDDYWAQYDQTPNRTPAPEPSAAVDHNMTEADYYARYGQEVQPAMDNHDPDEEIQNGEQIQSTLNGDAHSQNIQALLAQQHPAQPQQKPPSPPPYQISTADQTQNQRQPQSTEEHKEISQPRPSSSSSRAGSDAVARLEDAAERYNASEVGIKQHISSSMKSMYRLAKSVGMEREEFGELVERELEGLKVLEGDE